MTGINRNTYYPSVVLPRGRRIVGFATKVRTKAMRWCEAHLTDPRAVAQVLVYAPRSSRPEMRFTLAWGEAAWKRV